MHFGVRVAVQLWNQIPLTDANRLKYPKKVVLVVYVPMDLFCYSGSLKMGPSSMVWVSSLVYGNCQSEESPVTVTPLPRAMLRRGAARAAPVTLVIRKPILDNDDDDSGDGGGGGGSSECAPSLNCHSFSHSLTYPPQFIPSSPPMLCSTIADLFSPL